MDARKQNVDEINKYLSYLKGKFTPNKTLMTAISVHLRENARENILDQGANIPINYGAGFASTNVWPRNKMFKGKALLASRTLFRSIQAKATENEAIAFTNHIGARLQHFGGEVKAKKKLGSVKRKKDVWAMEQYFWAMFYKSNKKEKMFKILALHMQKHNSITVPARPFMVLTDPYIEMIIEEIRQHVLH
ncbi:MAG: phage virion morphogenesis protein [Ignavibacterium sp.]|nr:phage virion morphogenesis protein [Ignavibacterium sp.]